MNIEIEDYSHFANITKYTEITDNIIMLPIEYDYQDSKKCLFDKHDLNIVKIKIMSHPIFLINRLDLVKAQKYIDYAIKSKDAESYGVEELKSRLNNFETVLFPNLQFLSSGLIITGGICTICNNALENCDHIKWEIYRGKLCFRANHEIVRVDHVALVDNPEDKGCFLTQIEDQNGNRIDSLTRKIIKKNTNKNPSKSMKCKVLR